MTAAPARIGAASREAMAQWTSGLHDAVTAMFERLDGSRFEEASWQRKGGGGGQARLLAEGKVFDSWAGSLGPREYREFALPYMARTIKIAKTAGVPVIAFAPGAGWALGEIAEATGCDVLGVDWHTDAAWARGVADATNCGLQGNLDPTTLYADPAVIKERTEAMLSAIDGPGYIANLGHGILPDIPVEHARTFIETVQAWDSRAAHRRAQAAEAGR